jgi:hypothetical protein
MKHWWIIQWIKFIYSWGFAAAGMIDKAIKI